MYDFAEMQTLTSKIILMMEYVCVPSNLVHNLNRMIRLFKKIIHNEHNENKKNY